MLMLMNENLWNYFPCELIQLDILILNVALLLLDIYAASPECCCGRKLEELIHSNLYTFGAVACKQCTEVIVIES